MNPDLEIQLIAVLTSAACALPGAFLMLRKLSMLSDSISHTILLGIVLAYFITQDLSSPFLIVGAAIMGVVTVWITESLNKSGLVAEDSAVGVVFPLLFSIAIMLISKYGGSAHLDTDAVLLGELAFAPFNRLIIMGADLGAKGAYIVGTLALINLSAIVIFYKELKITTFDPMLASILSISPVIIHYGLAALTSLTAVGAFETVGSVLVIAFMIGPPAAAYLLSDKLSSILILSVLIGGACSVVGYQIARIWDVSISGCISITIGAAFLTAFVFSPTHGLIGSALRKKRIYLSLSSKTVIIHLYKNSNIKEGGFVRESLDIIKKKLNLNNRIIDKVVRQLCEDGFIKTPGAGKIELTWKGIDEAISILAA